MHQANLKLIFVTSTKLDSSYSLAHTQTIVILVYRIDMSSQNFKDTFKSVGAAFFGVQSDKNREKDFKQGKFSYFIIAGLIAVILFITALVAIVSLVIPS
jgi:hypothetical protein